jgi:hypothetical protein
MPGFNEHVGITEVKDGVVNAIDCRLQCHLLHPICLEIINDARGDYISDFRPMHIEFVLIGNTDPQLE